MLCNDDLNNLLPSIKVVRVFKSEVFICTGSFARVGGDGRGEKCMQNDGLNTS
jgi:hypothetical protein